MKRLLLFAICLCGCQDPPPPPKPTRQTPSAEQVGEGLGGRAKGVTEGFKKGWKERKDEPK